MRLKKEHIEALLTMIAEGLQSDEINDRAALLENPFNVSKEQVSYYRKTRHVKTLELQDTYQNNALNTGLARKCIRVLKLQKLADLIEQDLFESRTLWLQDKKGIGSGDVADIYDFEVFNKAEVDAYRGILDDIAKEMGGRIVNNIEKSIDLSKLTPEQLKRIADGEELLKVLAG